MPKLKRHLLTIFAGLFFVSNSWAMVSPISIGLFPDFEFPAFDSTVAGLRASLLWGKHRNMYGLDLGVIGNVTDENFVGTALSGVFNKSKDTTVLGLQAAFGGNFTSGSTRVVGGQFAGLLNQNTGTSTVLGIQAALIMNRVTTVVGLQTGLYNSADRVVGLQLGLINRTKSLHGVQLGMINLAENGLFSVFPFINVGF